MIQFAWGPKHPYESVQEPFSTFVVIALEMEDVLFLLPNKSKYFSSD